MLIEPARTPDPAPLLSEARADLEQRAYYQKLPADEQAAEVRRAARRLALLKSPIGRRAAAVGQSLDELLVATREFLADYPDARAADAACRDAICAAGLQAPDFDGPVPERYGWGLQTYRETPAELTGWLHIFEVFAVRIEECEWEDC